MKEFKFACPTCRQHIKIAAEFEGRRIDCPSCQTTIIVPAPPEVEGLIPIASPAQPAARPKAAAPPSTRQVPMESSPPAESASAKTETSIPAPAKPAQPTGRPKVITVAPMGETRVAVLTPRLKLEIVRAIRARLADKSHWLPGKKEAGGYNYAARREGEQWVSVSPTDVTATHLSLFGAVLLEFHRRNVMRVTAGRRRFLDEELPAAIQKVLGQEPGPSPSSEADREALTYEQCLAVLDVLEQRYQRETEKSLKHERERKIQHIRLGDLVKKLEKSLPVPAEEVASALYYELEDINQRLDELEQNSNVEA